MKQELSSNLKSQPVAKTWLFIGGLLALGAVMMFVQELPAMRRELKLSRM